MPDSGSVYLEPDSLPSCWPYWVWGREYLYPDSSCFWVFCPSGLENVGLRKPVVLGNSNWGRWLSPDWPAGKTWELVFTGPNVVEVGLVYWEIDDRPLTGRELSRPSDDAAEISYWALAGRLYWEVAGWLL